MTRPNSKTVWLLTAGAFFAFFVFGFSDNLKGPTLPALLADLKLNYSLGGTIFLGAYLGFMAATLSTGLIADRVGEKFVMVLAGVSLALGIIGYSSFSAPLLLTLSMILLGFGMGSLELGCNSLIVHLHASDKGRYLNLMGVNHGLGSTLAPLYAGLLLSAGASWRTVYRWDLAAVAVLIVFFSLVAFPGKENLPAGEEKVDFRRIVRTAFSQQMAWHYAAISIYVAFELGISSWIVEYLQKMHGQSVTQSTQALSLYFGVIMLGRFLGSFVVERLGYLRSILAASLCASLCIALGLFGPASLLYMIPASGFFLSIIFPTLTASATDAHKENMNTLLGLLFTFAGFGGILGPWLVGIVSDLAGLQTGFSLNLAFGLITALCALVLMRLQPGHA